MFFPDPKESSRARDLGSIPLFLIPLAIVYAQSTTCCFALVAVFSRNYSCSLPH